MRARTKATPKLSHELAARPTWIAGGADQSVAVSLDHVPVVLRAA
jgi:hypothetical protein